MRMHIILHQGEYEKAIESYDKAIELNSNHPNAYFNRCCTYYCQENYARAIEDLEKILKTDDHYYKAQLFLGHIYRDKRKYKKAIKYYSSIPKNDPDYELAQTDLRKTKGRRNLKNLVIVSIVIALLAVGIIRFFPQLLPV